MQNLQRIRLWRGLSQSQLSQLSNVPQVTIRQHENGKNRSTDVETAEKLAAVLKVPSQVLWMELPWEFDLKQNAIKSGRPRKIKEGEQLETT